MRTKHLGMGIYTIVALPLLLAVASPVSAAPISIEITATVRTVDDYDNLLGGAVEPGDVITGYYTYDSETEDSNAHPNVGDYRHDSAPFGIFLEVNGLAFHTDAGNVNFLLEIVNDLYGGDNYLLRSYNNVFAVSAPGDEPMEPDNHISWQLDDPTATALSSTDCPTLPPVLDDWESLFGLDISSHGVAPGAWGFLIRAEVTSAVLLDEPVQTKLKTWGRVKAERR